MAATSFLLEMGAPDTLLAQAVLSELPVLRANAHIHLPPNFSAFATVEQAVDLAASEGVALLGASNYYDYSVYREFTERATAKRLFPVFGLEIITLVDDLLQAGVKVNDPGNPGKFYVCGKGITRFDPLSNEAATLLETIRAHDSARMASMVALLNDYFGGKRIPVALTAEGIRATVAERAGVAVETVYLQERHLAQAFQEALFAQVGVADLPTVIEFVFDGPIKGDATNPGAVQAEIRSRLMKAGKPAFVPETFVTFEHAYRLILALGGIPCYPTLADGAQPICGFEEPVEELIARIRVRGLVCAELIPIRNQPDVLERYVLAMRAAGLFVTAGTEHNTPDLLPLEPTCVNGQPIPDRVKAIFAEGACVLVGHQYLTAHGYPGYVDGTGKPFAGYGSDEERITAFAHIGAAVLKAFARR